MSKCYYENCIFFDALASLDFKLSVSGPGMFLQLAHLRVFQIYLTPAVINTGVEKSSSPCASWGARPRLAGSNGVQGPPSKNFP